MPRYRGGNGPPVQGSALGKEGRKYGVGMGENCPFMHETRLLYSIDLLGGGAGYLCRWGGSGKLGLRGDLVCRGRANCLGKKYGALLGAGFVYRGKKCVCAGGEGFFMHGKRLLYPTNYWAEVPGSGGKNAPTLSYPPSRIPKTKKIELYPNLELYRG